MDFTGASSIVVISPAASLNLSAAESTFLYTGYPFIGLVVTQIFVASVYKKLHMAVFCMVMV